MTIYKASRTLVYDYYSKWPSVSKSAVRMFELSTTPLAALVVQEGESFSYDAASDIKWRKNGVIVGPEIVELNSGRYQINGVLIGHVLEQRLRSLRTKEQQFHYMLGLPAEVKYRVILRKVMLRIHERVVSRDTYVFPITNETLESFVSDLPTQRTLQVEY